MFDLLPETPAIYAAWERLVIQHQVYGKPAHDARLVAAMHVHGLTAILTFDKAGFSRYPGITVLIRLMSFLPPPETRRALEGPLFP